MSVTYGTMDKALKGWRFTCREKGRFVIYFDEEGEMAIIYPQRHDTETVPPRYISMARRHVIERRYVVDQKEFDLALAEIAA